MEQAESRSVEEALAAFYQRQGLPADGGTSASGWRIALSRAWVPVPNFSWRKKALPLHDLHHVVTGYACSPIGEFEMAAWEFAAGRYPHAGATAFCLPLVGIGAIIAPRRTLAAFVRGRASRTLYPRPLTPALLRTGIRELKRSLVPDTEPRAGAGDLVAFAALAAASLTWTMAPIALVGALLYFA